MRLVRIVGTIAILFVVVLVSSLGLYGQTAVGEVNGIITDTQGAVVADATVKLTNQATKIETNARTNGAGGFTFINVRPGSYVLSVEKQGFKKTSVNPFDVGVNQTVTHNIKM